LQSKLIYQRTGFLRHREAAGRGDPAAAPALPARRFPADRPTRCLHRVGQIA